MPDVYVIPMEIDGLKCECVERTTDDFERSVITHRIIGYNGPLLEDGGLNGRSVSFDTLWLRENYANHEIFLKQYSKSFAENKLVHPVYGTLLGKIQQVSVIHNSTEKKAAHISIKFMQHGEPQMHNDFSHLFGKDAENTEMVLEGMEKKAQEVIKNKTTLMSRMNEVRSMMATAKAQVSQGMNVFNSAVEAIVYPSTLAGEMLGAAVSICDAANGNLDKIIQSPSAAIFGVRERLSAIRHRLERSEDLGGDILSDLILSYSLFNECLLIAFVNDDYASRKNTEYLESVDMQSGLQKALKNMKIFAQEIIRADRVNTTALAATVNITENGVEQTLAGMNNEKELNFNQETSIYRILLSRLIPPGYAEVICRRNNIENPNRVSGKIFIPILEDRR